MQNSIATIKVMIQDYTVYNEGNYDGDVLHLCETLSSAPELFNAASSDNGYIAPSYLFNKLEDAMVFVNDLKRSLGSLTNKDLLSFDGSNTLVILLQNKKD